MNGPLPVSPRLRIRVELTRTVPPEIRRVYALWLGLAGTRIVRGARRYVYPARIIVVGIVTLDADKNSNPGQSKNEVRRC